MGYNGIAIHGSLIVPTSTLVLGLWSTVESTIYSSGSSSLRFWVYAVVLPLRTVTKVLTGAV